MPRVIRIVRYQPLPNAVLERPEHAEHMNLRSLVRGDEPDVQANFPQIDPDVIDVVEFQKNVTQ